MNIASGLSAIKSGFELIKSLREVMGRSDANAGEIQARLVELQGLLLDAQEALADAQEESRELKRSNDELKHLRALENEVLFEEGVYWYKDWPFCRTCWLTDKKLIRLTGLHMPNPHWQCPVHKAQYKFKRTPADFTSL